MKLAHQHLLPIARRLATTALALLCGMAANGAFANTPGDPESAGDPPGRVGRLSDTTGQVWFFSPDAGEWISATRNRPLTSGDRLATDAGARAEVRIGSTTLRLDSGSELEVQRLDDERVVLQLHNGSATARLRNREAADEFEMNTGEGRFRTQRTGRYRFDRRDETSHLTVASGQAIYEGPGSALTVYSGQRAEFWIDRANAAQYSITEPARDAFAAWNSERDRGDDRSASSRYVSPEMTGAEDLDRHGRWEENPEYGPLWIPRAVSPGWAPYSTGHWAWVRPWGWTWVDDAAWGFAPFHYGRWVWFRSSWCWAPGTRVARPVYAPALVGWVGGPNVSVSVSIGSGRGPAVGWFPLAPREVYVPTYRVSPGYVRNVNVTHVTNITNITTIVNNPQAAMAQRDFSNRKFPHAVTVVPTSVMTGRQPVGPAAAQMRDAPGAQELIHQPTRGSALVAAPVTAPVAPRTVDERRVIKSATGTPLGTSPGASLSTSPGTSTPPPMVAPQAAPSRQNHPMLRRGEDGQQALPAVPGQAAPGSTAPQAPRGNDPREAVRVMPAPPTAAIIAPPPVPQVAPQAPARAQITATLPAPVVPAVAPNVPQVLAPARPAAQREISERGGQAVPQMEVRGRQPRLAANEGARAPGAAPQAVAAPAPPAAAQVQAPPAARPPEAQRPAVPQAKPAEAPHRGRGDGQQREGRDPRERNQAN